jgi:hypothetical protein
MAVWYYITHRVLQKRVCMYVCMYVCVYVCMYVYLYDFKAILRNFPKCLYYDSTGASPGPFVKRTKKQLFVAYDEKLVTFVE